MKDSLKRRCEQFIENRDRIKGAFVWESSYFYPLGASIFTGKGRMADVDRMKECRDLLKHNTGVFSNFRGNGKLAIISMLALDENPERKLANALVVYDRLKEHFWGSEYLPLTAMAITDLAGEESYEELAARTRRIYDRMKSEHPFLTSGEDSTFAALLALSDRSEEAVVYEMNRCYEIIKPEFFSSNAVQSLSHILSLGEGGADMKCRRTMRGCRYGTGYELPTLGVLALLQTDISELADTIAEVDEWLRTKKGFGAFGVGAKQRLMYAGLLTSYDYAAEFTGEASAINAAAINGTIALVIAQEAALCASVAAVSATAAAASSSNS